MNLPQRLELSFKAEYSHCLSVLSTCRLIPVYACLLLSESSPTVLTWKTETQFCRKEFLRKSNQQSSWHCRWGYETCETIQTHGFLLDSQLCYLRRLICTLLLKAKFIMCQSIDNMVNTSLACFRLIHAHSWSVLLTLNMACRRTHAMWWHLYCPRGQVQRP